MQNTEYQEIRTIRQSIIKQLGTPKASGFHQFDCPFCGHRRKAGIGTGGAFVCFTCRRPVTTVDEWAELAGRLAVPILIDPMPIKRSPSRPAATWQHDPMHWHSRLIAPLDLVSRWQDYKPVSEESIMRYQLGYGSLPPIGANADGSPVYTMRCNHPRLTYSNIENADRQPCGFRGRQLSCTCQSDKPGDLKWLTVTGTSAWLWNSMSLARAAGRWIVVSENPIDGILGEQAMSDVVPVAGTAGAGTWRAEWTRLIVSARPRGVLIWYDNDLIGNPTEEARESLIAAWIAKQTAHGRPPTAAEIEYQRTKAMGPKIATWIRAAGVKAEPYQWGAGTAPKMDMGSFLMNGGVL